MTDLILTFCGGFICGILVTTVAVCLFQQRVVIIEDEEK